MQAMLIMVMIPFIHYDIKLLIYINLLLIFVGFYSLNYGYVHIHVYVPFVSNTSTISNYKSTFQSCENGNALCL